MTDHLKSSNTHHWAKIEEAGFSSGIWLLYQTYRFMGKWPFRILLYPVILYFYIGRRSAREASMEYLQALSTRYDVIKPTRWGSFQHFISFGESLLDKVLSHTGRYTLKDVSIAGRKPLEEQLAQGKGALLFTSHIGNLEVSKAIAQFREVAVTILVHTANSEKFNRIIRKVNPNANVNLMQIVDMGIEQAIVLASKVNAGEVIIIAADRIPPTQGRQDNVVSASFLGKSAHFPSGPYILAHLLQCPVFLVFCTQINGRYHLSYETFSEKVQLPRRDRDQKIAVYAQQYSDALERQCQKTPLQWFNFYPFWHEV